MLNPAAVKQLSEWCAPRAIGWQPLPCHGACAILLEPRSRLRCWQRMVLSFVEDSFELTTESGELLASASELRSVLDALDGGVAEAGASLFYPATLLPVGALVL